ncbi:ABC transporter permease [Rubrimonas sp.]|uniref:ABC transporter permease n=1 Tax=Rubrimonas sp. TaxID=2036015 RepID=UPI002FDE8E8B
MTAADRGARRPPAPPSRPQCQPRAYGWLELQLRVVFALILREMTTRFGRSAGGYLWAVLEPAGTVALLALVFSQIARHPPLGVDFALFFATGYVAFHCYMDISRNVSNAVRTNRALLTFPSVTMLDAIIARFLLQLLTTIFVGALILTVLVVTSRQPVALDLGAVLLAMGLAALLGLGVGALNCVLFAFSPTWERVFNVVNRPLFLISGVFFIYEALPRAAQDVIWWNPLMHVTAIMRTGFYPFYEPSYPSVVYVGFFALAPLAVGMLLLRLARARMLEDQ